MQKVISIVLVLSTALVLSSCGKQASEPLSLDGKPENVSNAQEVIGQEEFQPDTTEYLEIEQEPVPTPQSTAIPKEKPVATANISDSSLTIGQENAFLQAQQYLDYGGLSYTKLLDWLEDDGFTPEECQFAVDNCNADWNEQALLQARQYLDYGGLSYTKLLDWLEDDGFTSDQALYAIEKLGADWNEQAEIAAHNYMQYSVFSKSKLIEWLEDDGFTHEQAVYGVEKNGY